MNAQPRTSRVYVALCVNAAILLLILVALISHGTRSLAEVPGTTGHGLNVMPAQLSPQVWGCYVLDNDNQTLSVYSYSPGEHELRLAAARDVQYDRKVGDFNTSPSPSEIREMIERAKELPRAVPLPPVSPETRP
jgi:hypothetical protein